MTQKFSWGLLISIIAAIVLIAACGGNGVPRRTVAVQPKTEVGGGWVGTVYEVHLSDGTLCAVFGEGITCDWKQG